MKPFCHYLTMLSLLFFVQQACTAQDSSSTFFVNLPAKYFAEVSGKAGTLEKKIAAETEKVLLQLQKREERIRHQLSKIDSIAANSLFTTAGQRYKNLAQKLNNPLKTVQYIPFLDTLKTSLEFLSKNKELLSKVSSVRENVDGAEEKLNGLENQLQKAEEIKQFLTEQKQFLKEQLAKFGLIRQLKKLKKDMYYYGQQINEYKEMIKEPEKIERRAVDLLSRTKLFQDFMKKNSMLASLFRMPEDDPNDPVYLQSLAGLQTKAQVNQLIQNQVAGGGSNGMQQIQANVQEAQAQLNQLKEKLRQVSAAGGVPISIGTGGTGLPDFKPNGQKTKSFLKRIEYGTNMQTLRNNNLFPVTSDIGLSAGYKLNDKSIIGIGASYKIGWGQNIQRIKITHQGAGIRSFADYKLKKSFWLSGGFEMNYMSQFNSVEQLRQFSAWQQSGLIGLSKKFPINTKFFNNIKLQLLWDFLSYRQLPRTQPIVFRVGYTIK